jgi:PIN domain nuclease of toxin-antitoxin system
VLEVVAAARRGRLGFAVPAETWLVDSRRLPELHYEPVSTEIVQLAGSFGDGMHGDPADRIIAATATLLGVPLVTADTKLRVFPTLDTVW